MQIDEERFIDFENMLQRRVDDQARSRYIKRTGPLAVCTTLMASPKNDVEKDRSYTRTKRVDQQEQRSRFETVAGQPTQENTATAATKIKQRKTECSQRIKARSRR